MRIAIMGAGGIGAYVGARLAAAGEDVTFLARGAHLAAMQGHGLTVQSEVGDLRLDAVKATNDPRAVGPVDLVLFAVKLWDAEAAASTLAPLLGERTRVVTVQNGIDVLDLVARHVPRERVVGGVIYLPAVVTRPGVVTTTSRMHKLLVDRANGDAVVAALQAAAQRAVGFDVELTDSISLAVWEKFVRLAAFSAATSLMRSSIGPIMAHREARLFLRSLIEEGAAVASATGNPLAAGYSEETFISYDTFPPGQRASMANDLNAGRRLELEWLSGRMHTLGLQYAVPTPAHTAAYRGLVIHANGA
jgi:2-dehydropantoate 2-reductase